MNKHLGQPDDQRAACTGCGGLLDARFDRRRFLHVAVGSVIVAALTPAYAFAMPLQFRSPPRPRAFSSHSFQSSAEIALSQRIPVWFVTHTLKLA